MDTASHQELRDEWRATYRRGCPVPDRHRGARQQVGALRARRPAPLPDPVRFSELRRLLDGVTQKMLTQTLKALERDGLVRRTVYPTVPPRVEYRLTDLGRGLGKLTNAIGDWSVAHVAEILAARATYDERAARSGAPVE